MGCLISGGLRIPRAALAAAGLALALLLVGPAVAEVPDSACAGCHDIVDMFHKSPHGVYFSPAIPRSPRALVKHVTDRRSTTSHPATRRTSSIRPGPISSAPRRCA